ncbi:MAG: Ldh family oxidoreductase [Thermodesulfobacteriota bacterium]
MEKTYSHQKLKEFVIRVFLKMGCPQDQAEKAADILIAADLRGIDSHGVARLIGYVQLWETGRVNINPDIRIVHETPSTAVVDGDSGLGLVVAPVAMKMALDKAESAGTGWVAVRNSNHYGIAGYHAMEALSRDMVGISMTNASALVSPTFSKERMLGTNPIAVAIPADKEPPFVADFATTTAAYGKVEIQMRKNAPVPSGWVQDAAGNSTTDAFAVKKGGAMLPLGSDRDHGSHKGYCLGAIVDIFSAVCSGANYGPWASPFLSYLPLPDNPVGKGIGHFFGAMRIDAFRPAQEFKTHMDQWIRRFRSASPANGHPKVLIPGDPEREMTAQRLQSGIPLLAPVVEDLQQVAKKFAVPFDMNL